MATKTVLATLEAARKLITPEGAWTKQEAARDSSGNGLDSINPRAVCWCAYGAVWHFRLPSDLENEAESLLEEVRPDLVNFNDADTTTQADILAVFDEAIEKAKVTA